MKAASGYFPCSELRYSSMSPQEVQKYVADMQKQQEMVTVFLLVDHQNDMNSEMINSAFDSLYGVDDTEVDEETDKVLLEVAGMRMKGMTTNGE